MRNTIAIATILALSSVVPAMAATCPGTVVFQDAYTTPSPNLNVAPDANSTLAIKDGKAEAVFVKQGMARVAVYKGTLYADVNVCLTLTTPSTDKVEDQSAGLVFWAANEKNYYMLEISLNGQLTVAQGAQGGDYTHPLAWQVSPALAKGTGASNMLRVQTRGSVATVFVNDQQVGSVTGTAPSGGGLVGFYVSSSSSSLSTWDVSGFTVATP